jgi:hypothetical protein
MPGFDRDRHCCLLFPIVWGLVLAGCELVLDLPEPSSGNESSGNPNSGGPNSNDAPADDQPGPEPGSETPQQASERVLEEFAGCMTLANFRSADMAEKFGGMTTEIDAECENCHATGGHGFIASRVDEIFYATISTKKSHLLQYVKVDLTMGAAAAKIVVNTTSFAGVANAQAPHSEHPRFPCTLPNCDNQGMQALRQFYALTMAAKAGGTCPSPRPLED